MKPISPSRAGRALRLGGLALGAAAFLAVGTLGAFAQIEALTLQQMVQKTDGAVVGEVVDRSVVRVDHPVDGPGLYFTTITIRGKSLYTDQVITVPITFAGGFVGFSVAVCVDGVALSLFDVFVRRVALNFEEFYRKASFRNYCSE